MPPIWRRREGGSGTENELPQVTQLVQGGTQIGQAQIRRDSPTFFFGRPHITQNPHLGVTVTALEVKGARNCTQVHRPGPAMMLFRVRARKASRLCADVFLGAPACGYSKRRPVLESKRNDSCAGDGARSDLPRERREAGTWYRSRKAEVPRAKKYPLTGGPLSRTLGYHPGVPRLRNKVLTPGATF